MIDVVRGVGGVVVVVVVVAWWCGADAILGTITVMVMTDFRF